MGIILITSILIAVVLKLSYVSYLSELSLIEE